MKETIIGRIFVGVVVTVVAGLLVNPHPPWLLKEILHRLSPSPAPTRSIATPQPRRNPSPKLTAQAFYNRGNSKYNLKKYKEAIADYTKAIKLRPNYAKAYNSRSLSYRKLNYNKNAINDFRYSVKLYKQQKKQKN